jgi:hypothetical protein
MNETPATPAATRSFENALLNRETVGYAVCAKPLRFARLPDTVATTYAEIGDENCFYVFERQAEATARMAKIPSDDRLGWLFSIRKVSYLAATGRNDGPKLDPSGHPFAMRGFIVDASGATIEWRHPGKIGWRGPYIDVPPVKAEQPGPGLMQRIGSWLRGLLGRGASSQPQRRLRE